MTKEGWQKASAASLLGAAVVWLSIQLKEEKDDHAASVDYWRQRYHEEVKAHQKTQTGFTDYVRQSAQSLTMFVTRQ